MDNIIHYENDKFIGRTSFHPKLLASAIAVAVRRVDGVERLRGDMNFFLRYFFRRRRHLGLAIKPVGYKTIIVEISLVATYGSTAAELSYLVQEAALNVAQNKQITDEKIKRVDVRIIDIAQSKKKVEDEQKTAA